MNVTQVNCGLKDKAADHDVLAIKLFNMKYENTENTDNSTKTHRIKIYYDCFSNIY